MIRALLSIVCSTLCLAAGAATNYVDCAYMASSDEDYAAHDGTSWAKAFRTIQEGVDACSEGDTVLVAEGRYDAGGKASADDGWNRVYLATKGITLKSVAGAGKTFIVGARDGNTAVDTNGNGPNAVRCIFSTAADSVVEGFTLTDGAAHPTFDKENALRADGGGFQSSAVSALVDCVVTNCTGVRGGALRNALAVRCLIVDNTATQKGPAGNSSRFLNCVITGNRGGSGGGAVVSGTAVNCTFAVNDTSYVATENTRFFNCLAVCNSIIGDAMETGLHKADNSLFTAGTNAKGKTFFSSIENSITNASPVQLANPLFGDFRLLPTSDAIGLGDATHIASAVTLPTGVDRWLDFMGNAIAHEGPIAAGAIQSTAPVPQGGVLRFVNGIVAIDGMRPMSFVCYDGLYVVSDTPYRQFNVRAVMSAGEHLFGYKRMGKGYGDGIYMFPMPDDTLWMMAPETGLVYTNQLTKTTSCLYVNPDGDDSNDGLSEERPLKTIQKAISSVGKGVRAVIRCAEGDYDSDDGVQVAAGVTNRVSITEQSVRIIGAGAGKSVIWGRKDPADPAGDGYGRGPAAMRCVASTGGTYSAVQGFTLANGATGYEGDGSGNIPMHHGGAVYDSSHFVGKLWVTDCVIENSYGYRGAAFGGTYQRCRFTSSNGANGGIRYAKVYSCLLDYNLPGEGNRVMMSFNSAFYNCTAIGAQSGDTLAVSVGVTNSIIYRTATTTAAWSGWGGTYAYNPGVSLNYGIVKDPQLANPGTGASSANDYRILSTSPCVGGGLSYEGMARDYSPDFNGNPIVFMDGKPTVGAIQTFKQGLSVVGGNGVVLTPSGVNALESGETVTVSYDESAATRPVAAIRVNGVEETVENGKRWTFTAPAAGEPVTEAYSIEPVFSTNWYVNANASGNGGNGFRPETAKRSFHGEGGMLETGLVISGDCIHADEGVYDFGSKLGEGLQARLVVPQGVTVVADNGPESTIIVGADATTNPDSKGRGIDGVRGVVLARNSRLIGFTVTGGRANCNDDSLTGYGGGIYSHSTGYAVDCVVSNNAATRGGGMHEGTSIRCSFFDNWATANRAARSQGKAYGCVFDHNRGVNTVQNTVGLWNCTFGDDNLLEDCATEATVLAMPYGPVVNCLIKGFVDGATSYYPSGFTNCIFVTGKMASNMARDDFISLCNCVTTSVDKLNFATDYRPVIDGNLAVDGGTLEDVDLTALGACDINGGQRIYNGAIDIGAAEADWRPRFSEAIGPGVSVTNVSANVRLVDGRVRLADGDVLRGEWRSSGEDGRRAEFKCGFLANGGTLGGAVGAQSVSVTDETVSLEYSGMAAPRPLEFSFAGSGYGELFGFYQNLLGLTVIIR